MTASMSASPAPLDPSGAHAGPRRSLPRFFPWILAVVSLGMFLGGTWMMALRLDAFNKKTERPIFLFNEVETPRFNWHERPVSFTDADDPQGWTLVMRFGEEERRLRVTIPGDRRLPGLLPHRDWIRILRFAEGTGLSSEELDRRFLAGEIPERLVVVTRIPRADADPQTWGTAWVRDTSFAFYELKPDGSISEATLRFPKSKANQPYQEGELRENTWELLAALRLVPPGLGPKLKYREASMLAMGFTWPMAMLGVSGMVVALMIGGGGRPRRESSKAANQQISRS
jgi:hypothetical protein